MALTKISVRGAREHNLKGVDIDLPRDSLIVITGLSGSGKSSLAFDTVYAEGQRRYLEGLSAYARNFLEQLKKLLFGRPAVPKAQKQFLQQTCIAQDFSNFHSSFNTFRENS